MALVERTKIESTRAAIVAFTVPSDTIHGHSTCAKLNCCKTGVATRDDSVFMICATTSRHFSSGSEPVQRLRKTLLRTATLSWRFSSTPTQSAAIAQSQQGNAN